MLLDQFYKYSISQHADNEISATIELNKTHSVFEGHFPDTPIVPGVIQVLMVKEILADCLDKELTLSSAKSIKFLSMINPNEIPKFQAKISYSENENNYKVKALLFEGDKNILKLIGNYIEKKSK
jgi:3-hydroxyacyl-[acyl-carrier-protein] dehydratase